MFDLKILVPKGPLTTAAWPSLEYLVFLIGLISIFVLMLIGPMVFAKCMGLEEQEHYVNYTSYKFKVQFQYPTTWVESEKLTDKR